MDIKDTRFLKALDEDRNKFYTVRIIVLDKLDKPIKSIEGRVLPGSSVSINGNSSVRRTCNINLIAEEDRNDLTNIENFLSINKKIKIALGVEKQIDYSKDIYYFPEKERFFPAVGNKGNIYVDRNTMTYWIWTGATYEEISSPFEYQSVLTWFPLGVFVINNPNITHSFGGCNISLSCQDKMCLLNGTMGGTFQAPVTFDSYNQILGKVVCEEDPRTDSSLIPNDYTFYIYEDKSYIWSLEYGWSESPTIGEKGAGDIVERHQLIYDIIQTAVANYGGESLSRIIINDIPREIKQLIRYIGSSPLYFNRETGQYTTDDNYYLNEEVEEGEKGIWDIYEYGEDIGYVYTSFIYPQDKKLEANHGDNVCTILDAIKNTLGNYEYFYDIDGNFVFQEIKNYLNTSYNPTEKAYDVQRFYLDNNRDAEFTLENNSLRLLGKENYKIDLCGYQKSVYTFEEGNGLISSYSNTPNYSNIKNDFHVWGKNSNNRTTHYHIAVKEQPKIMQEREVVFLKDENEDEKYNGRIRLANQYDSDDVKVSYTPSDWRAELYLQGLEVAASGGRPDIYQQELLDLFDGIYEFGYYDEVNIWQAEGRFKADIVNKSNQLEYFIDYLEPVDRLYGISVDDINTKIQTHEQDKIVRIYNNEVPDYIIIDVDMSETYKDDLAYRCDSEGQKYSLVSHELYLNFAIGTLGYSSQEVARNLLYQYTSYNESISISCIPIYYLDTNRRITVRDKRSGINGDYVINSITLPLDAGGTMSISASRVLDRI